MRKERRDNIMRSMGQGERNHFRRIISDLSSDMKASPGHRVTVREILESRGEEFPPELRAPVEAVMERDEMGPKLGEQPPDFFLKSLGSDERVRLSSFQGQRPVAIAFGSYT